jgi:hypothetical protein
VLFSANKAKLVNELFFTIENLFNAANKQVEKKMKSNRSRDSSRLKWTIIVLLSFLTIGVRGNPDAKRLYDDLLSNYNRLIRPVMNNTDTILVKLGLRLSQLIDLVSAAL